MMVDLRLNTSLSSGRRWVDILADFAEQAHLPGALMDSLLISK